MNEDDHERRDQVIDTSRWTGLDYDAPPRRPIRLDPGEAKLAGRWLLMFVGAFALDAIWLAVLKWHSPEAPSAITGRMVALHLPCRSGPCGPVFYVTPLAAYIHYLLWIAKSALFGIAVVWFITKKLRGQL